MHDGVTTYGADRGAYEGLIRDAGIEPCAHAISVSDNALMIRDIETVCERVSTTPSFSVISVSF